MQRKDYELIARVIREEPDMGTRRRLTNRFIKRIVLADNENFDADYFKVACLADQGQELPPRPRNAKGRAILKQLAARI